MIKQILAQIRTPAPAGCSTPEFGEALENFFLTKSLHSKRNYAVRFRQFSEFQQRPRSHWPGALECFLRLPEATATQINERYLAWLIANKPGWNRPGGRMGTGLIPVTRHFHSRDLTSWSLPRHYDIKSERVWEACEPAFRNKIAEYLESLRVRSFSPMTLKRAGIGLRVLGRHLKEKHVSYLEVNYERAVDYVRTVLARKDWGEWHSHSVIWHARAFYKWLRRRREVSENAFEEIGNIKRTKRLPEHLSEDEINRMLALPLEPLERSLLELLYATGCRLGEVQSLELRDLNLEARTIKCMGKGRKERILIFNQATELALKEYLPLRKAILVKTLRGEQACLFVSKFGNRIDRTKVDDLIKSIAWRAGLAKRVTPHVIRHSYACHLLNHGADLYSIMTLLGHSSLASTTRYLHIATDRLSEVYRRCHPRK